MRIERIAANRLNAAEYNPRLDIGPGDPEYEKLKRSMQEFGYITPIVWNNVTGNVVGGHQRLKVLLDLGETEINCVVVSLDADREKLLNLALNKISGIWDEDKLKELLGSLSGDVFDVKLTGFDDRELKALFPKARDSEKRESGDKPAGTHICPRCGFTW